MIAPPIIFPNVTIIKFNIKSKIPILAPSIIPIGMKNIFATLCSNPHKTNNIIGNQHANILEITSCDAVAIHTAKTTITLHSIPLIINSKAVSATYDSAIDIALLAASPVSVPP